jgi:uncharacterized phage protein gp47/JayE
MATFPLATLGPTITAAGISIPPYTDVYQSLQASFQAIFGSDAYIDPDSQDGQMLAIVAKAITDCNLQAVNIYNSFSPATAVGRALANNVKINAIKKKIATASTAVLEIVGQVGREITDGLAEDASGNKWALPASVVIPPAGFILVTATCQADGAISADANTITKIATPTLGWQSVTNPDPAAPGAPIESDGALRIRQSRSTALPSQTILAGIVGALYELDGVVEVTPYENDTDATDVNGLPEHSICFVILGGDSQEIAETILRKKTPGAYTYGDVVIPVVDQFGYTNMIRYFIPDEVDIKVEVTIDPLAGYTTAVGEQIKEAVAAYINALGSGKGVIIPKLYVPAQLDFGQGSETYDLQSIRIAIVPAAFGTANISVAFNARAVCDVANITIVT